MTIYTGLFLLIGAPILLIASAPAALADADFPPTLDCVEVIHAEANEQLTAYKSTKENPPFQITFSRDGEQWVMVARLGSEKVVAVEGPEAITFIETPPLGVMNTTSIARLRQSGSYGAIHSRNTIAFGQLIPSQFVLDCRAR